MVQTKDEIIKSYKNATNKSNQIGVLAELNLTSKQAILNVLSEAGILGSTTEKKQFKFTNEIDAKLMDLAEQKLTYAEIAEKLDLTVTQVNNRLWLLRKREKEKRNSAPGEVKTYQQSIVKEEVPNTVEADVSYSAPNIVVELVAAELERVNALFEPIKSEYEDLKQTRDELISYLDFITHTKIKTL